MSRRSELPQTRRHIFVFDEDWEYLEGQYGQASQAKLGTGVAIRALVHKFVLGQKARVQNILDAEPRERTPLVDRPEVNGKSELS